VRHPLNKRGEINPGGGSLGTPAHTKRGPLMIALKGGKDRHRTEKRYRDPTLGTLISFFSQRKRTCEITGDPQQRRGVASYGHGLLPTPRSPVLQSPPLREHQPEPESFPLPRGEALRGGSQRSSNLPRRTEGGSSEDISHKFF